jgi:peptide/nickel transport system ATP-binding protein
MEGVGVSFPRGGYPPRALRAVHGLDLQLSRGEIVALVGESGSGKSTIAKLIARLLEPSEGRILVDGVDVTRGRVGRDFRSQVQMVFQDPFSSLNPTKTIAHHIQRPLLLHGKASHATVSDKVLELLSDVGLQPAEQFARAMPHALSGGQRQRVAIARALAPEPGLLLADEPTSMLDVSVRMEVLRLLRRLREDRGLAILLITHDLGAAAWLADRVGVLYGGQLLEMGPSDEVLAHPKHPYTQLLLAAAPRRGGSLHDPLPADRGAPELINPGPGCPFAARCRARVAACTARMPEPHVVARGHVARCHVLTSGAREM